MKSPKEDKNVTDCCLKWFDKNKFKKFLAIIDSNRFGDKNKVNSSKFKGVFKYVDIKNVVNNNKNNTTSEISAKKSLSTLNEIKNAEKIKRKWCNPG